MAWIGQGLRALIATPRDDAGRVPPWAWGVMAALAALVPALWMWGFTVDDALISVRYARHLADGAGYRFNASGPSTDGVTPLPWAFVLAPFAHAGALVVLGRAKALGIVVWTLTASAWGIYVGRARAPWWAKGVCMLALAVCIPCAAHAVSGMETSLATCLCTWAALLHARPRAAAILSGLAASLRPELVPWAIIVAVGFEAVRGTTPARALLAVVMAAFPFALCCAIRVVVFGHAAPLSLSAKPSDLMHGLAYVGAASLASLAPALAFAPLALTRAERPARVLAVAGLEHVVAVACAGGDWMPYARLAAPIVPSLLFAFVLVAPYVTMTATVTRLVVAFAIAGWLDPKNARALRAAGHDRARMIEQAASLLRDSKRVAALDIGWVSAVSEASIIDLAGVTDPEVAVLPGGHTSKRIDAAFLLGREPDVALFYSPCLPSTLEGVTPATFSRVVEARLAASSLFVQKFEPATFLPLGNEGAGYVLYRRRVESRD